MLETIVGVLFVASLCAIVLYFLRRGWQLLKEIGDALEHPFNE